MTQTSTLKKSAQYTLQMSSTDSLILPEALCNQLNWQSGDRLTLTIESDGSLHLVSRRQQIQKIQGMFQDVAPGISLADELIQDRRQEAQQDN